VTTPTLAGQSILVVEDEYLVAMSLSDQLKDAGADVIGPAAFVEKAARLIDTHKTIDYALLDLNLGGESSIPLADLLLRKGVPFAFLTGYDAAVIPPAYGAVHRLGKPLSASELVRHVCTALADEETDGA